MATVRREEDHQYLTFVLAEEAFAVPITRVREVLEFTEVTRVPRMPGYMRGVINLRGSVVPVLDLKMRLGLGQTAKAVNTCVIILEVDVNDEVLVLGMMADAVQEVFLLDPGEIEPPPKLGTRLDNRFLRGMGKRGEEFLILLDVDRVFRADETVDASDCATKQGCAAGGPTATERANLYEAGV